MFMTALMLGARCALAALAFGTLGASPTHADDKGKALTEAYNASGRALFGRLAVKPGNLVISPYSIGVAMDMALAGARGETESEMVLVLKHRLGRAARADAATALSAGLAQHASQCQVADAAGGRAQEVKTEKPESNDDAPTAKPACVKLSVANALFVRSGAIAASFRDLVKSKYAAALFDEPKLEDINGFVAEKTEGKIERILERLDPQTSAVLVNAVYFNAPWAIPFDKQQTVDTDFHVSASETATVPMMRKAVSLPVASGEGFKAVRLPYGAAALGMVVVLPDAVDAVSKVAEALDAKRQADLFAALKAKKPEPVDLGLPRFKVASKADLIEPYSKLGMKLAFSDAKADFSGMTGRKDALRISQIEHRAVLEVSEAGTEAAAATAVEVLKRNFKVEPERLIFRVDRPFLLYVVDDATGAVLFQGRVSDPREPKA
jgi:leukocyte elastase inhibitor